MQEADGCSNVTPPASGPEHARHGCRIQQAEMVLVGPPGRHTQMSSTSLPPLRGVGAGLLRNNGSCSSNPTRCRSLSPRPTPRCRSGARPRRRTTGPATAAGFHRRSVGDRQRRSTHRGSNHSGRGPGDLLDTDVNGEPARRWRWSDSVELATCSSRRAGHRPCRGARRPVFNEISPRADSVSVGGTGGAGALGPLRRVRVWVAISFSHGSEAPSWHHPYRSHRMLAKG